jgi:hypothetical protein
MKKLAYIVASSALVISALAQGTVNVNNRGLTPPQLVTGVNLSNPQGPFAPAGSLVGVAYVAQIVYGPGNTPLGDPMPFRSNGTGLGGNTTTLSTSPGTWNPGAAGIRTLTGFAEGANVSMRVNVWDSTVFADWASASAALASGGILPTQNGGNATQAGSSASFTYTVGAAANPASLTIANFQGFTLTGIPVVPEPTTIALGALGAAALLWRRRK